MVNQKRQSFRNLYFPGLISLAFLPLIFIVYSSYVNLSKTTYGVSVVWGDESMIKFWAEYQKRPFNPDTYRKFKNDFLTGDENKDAGVLSRFQRNVTMLSNSKDLTNGFSISFTTNTKYEELISCIDICNQASNRHIAFIIYKDKILVWYGEPYQQPPPPKHSDAVEA